MIYHLVVGVLTGVVFGFAFEKSKVFEAASILGQLLFKRFIMLKVLMTAMITSMIVIALLQQGDLFEVKVKDLNLVTNILGGSILGIGIAIAGACPGTVFAQIGVGYKDALFTFAGGLFAAFVYSFYSCDLNELFSPWSMGKVTLDQLIGVNPIIIVIGVVLTLIVMMVIIEIFWKWKEEVKYFV